MYEQESEHFRREEKRTEESTQQAQKDIIELRLRLKEARLVRNRKEEIEALAVQVQQEPSRTQTKTEIEALQKDMAILKEQRALLDEKFDLRKRQFQLLMHAIAELNSELNA